MKKKLFVISMAALLVLLSGILIHSADATICCEEVWNCCCAPSNLGIPLSSYGCACTAEKVVKFCKYDIYDYEV